MLLWREENAARTRLCNGGRYVRHRFTAETRVSIVRCAVKAELNGIIETTSGSQKVNRSVVAVKTHKNIS